MSYANSRDPYADAQPKLSRLESLASKAEELNRELAQLSVSAPPTQTAPGEDNSALRRKLQEHRSRIEAKQHELSSVKSELDSLVADLEECCRELDSRSHSYEHDAERQRSSAHLIDDGNIRSDYTGAANQMAYKATERRAQSDDIRSRLDKVQSRIASTGRVSHGSIGIDGTVDNLYRLLPADKSTGGSYAIRSYSSPIGQNFGYMFSHARGKKRCLYGSSSTGRGPKGY